MPEYAHKRHFTVEQANALIPKVGPLLLKLQDALQLFEEQRSGAIQALQLARTNGKGERPPEPDGLEVLRELAGRIEDHGVVVKDFEQGLIDFPSLREGEEVYLCWKLGEPVVAAWHGLKEGFDGRKPL